MQMAARKIWVAICPKPEQTLIIGRWSIEGKRLTLSLGDHENSQPFTFYEGQLVFPNIPKRRGFWEKIEWAE